MAFSEIKSTNSAAHNLTGDWQQADSGGIASLGDRSFFPTGELSAPSGLPHIYLFFNIHVSSLKRRRGFACQFA